MEAIPPKRIATSNITIRPFHPADRKAARELILEGLGEHWGFIDYTLNPDVDDIQANYPAQGHPFLVAIDGDELVGTGALIREAPGVARVVRMSVSRKHRRKGIGRQMLSTLEAIARERGDTRLVLETNLTWHDAQGLYTRYGFLEYDRDDELVHMMMDLR